MKLSERDEEFQLLDRLYAGSARGKGAIVLVNSPVGCGKTALLQSFAERAVERGGLFLSVTASASERLHRFGLIDQLINALRAAGVEADPCAAEDLGGKAPGHDPRGARPVPLGLLQQISRTVFECAEKRPLVVSIDDVHFADEPSLECLRYLSRRIDSSAVMIVMNESSCHERELASLHAEILHLANCHRIRLAPLAAAGIAELLTERLGVCPAWETVALWAESSGGNPLLLDALIEDCAEQAETPGEPEPGESFRYAFLRCLYRCEPEMLEVARAVAVLGESASPSLVGDFLGGDVASVRRSIAGLNAAGLLSAVRFRHEVAQLTVLADIPTRKLFEMHGRAARLLHESGASTLAVADQLMAAHDSVKAPWRVDILHEAAHEAIDTGDIARAVGYLRHASGICTDAAQEARINAALAEAQWLTDPAKAARHLQHLSQLVRAGLLTDDDALVPVRQLLWRGDFVQADALLQSIEAGEGGESGQPPTAAQSDVTLTRLWLSFCYPGLTRDAMGGETKPGEFGHHFDVPPGASGPMSTLAFLNLSTNTTGDEGQEADRVLHGTQAGSPLATTLLALILLIQTYRLDEAVLWSEQLLEEPWIRRVPMRRALLETIKSAAALYRGDVAEAAESARIALDLAAPSAWGVVVGLPLALAVRASTELGDFDAVTSYLNLPVPPVMFDTPFVLPYLQAFGRYHLAMGRPHAALTNFQSCGDLMAKWRFDLPELPELTDWRNDAAAALVAMGRNDRARALMEEQLTRLGEGRSRVRGIALRHLAATSTVRERVPLLQGAVRILTACGDRLELAHAQADLKAAAEEFAQLEPPLGWQEPAASSAEQQDTPELRSLLASHHREDKDVEGTAADGADLFPVLTELTDAERRVGALAASGCTNREIAGKLFITVSTVEQHLTKIYRKLKVRSRSGLPSELMSMTDIPCSPNGR